MRLLQPLRRREMALLWGGLSLSAIGDQLYAVALGWIGVGVFGAEAGYLSAAQAAIVMIAALASGRWADRWDAQRSLIGADLVRACALLLLVASWLWTGAAHAAPLVAAVLVLAAGQAVFQPALQVVLPHVAADTRLLPAANALMDATDRSARLLGPGLIALLAGILPQVHFLTVDAGSFLVSAGAVALIRRRRPTARLARAAPEPIGRGIARGVWAMRRHALLGYILQTTALVNGAWVAAYFLALPLLIERRGLRGLDGTGLGAFGLVIAAYGCTNLLATLTLGGRTLPARPQWQMFGGSLVVGVGTVLVGLSALLPPREALGAIAASAALAAIGGPMKDIPFAVLRQTRVAGGDIAAAMRVYIAASSAGALAVLLLAPALIRGVGEVAVIVLCGSAMFGSGLVGLWRHRAWREDPASDGGQDGGG